MHSTNFRFFKNFPNYEKSSYRHKNMNKTNLERHAVFFTWERISVSPFGANQLLQINKVICIVVTTRCHYAGADTYKFIFNEGGKPKKCGQHDAERKTCKIRKQSVVFIFCICAKEKENISQSNG